MLHLEKSSQFLPAFSGGKLYNFADATHTPQGDENVGHKPMDSYIADATHTPQGDENHPEFDLTSVQLTDALHTPVRGRKLQSLP